MAPRTCPCPAPVQPGHTSLLVSPSDVQHVPASGPFHLRSPPPGLLFLQTSSSSTSSFYSGFCSDTLKVFPDHSYYKALFFSLASYLDVFCCLHCTYNSLILYHLFAVHGQSPHYNESTVSAEPTLPSCLQCVDHTWRKEVLKKYLLVE